MAVEDFQYFLLHLSRGQQIGPSLFIALSCEKPQVMPDFAQHGFGLFFDFRQQHFLSAHAIIIHKNAKIGKLQTHIVARPEHQRRCFWRGRS